MALGLKLEATNETSQGWHFALYQKQPHEVGLKNMAWKVLKLSKPDPIHGEPSTKGDIPWTLNFEVTVPQSDDGHVYVGGIHRDAAVGKNYELYLSPSGYKQFKEAGTGEPGFIHIMNNTEKSQNLGINLSKSLLAMQMDVMPGVRAQFKITPTYYLGLFTNLEQGSFVDSDAAIGPVEIHFPPGMTTVETKAYVKDGKDSLTIDSYGPGH